MANQRRRHDAVEHAPAGSPEGGQFTSGGGGGVGSTPTGAKTRKIGETSTGKAIHEPSTALVRAVTSMNADPADQNRSNRVHEIAAANVAARHPDFNAAEHRQATTIHAQAASTARAAGSHATATAHNAMAAAHNKAAPRVGIERRAAQGVHAQAAKAQAERSAYHSRRRAAEASGPPRRK